MSSPPAPTDSETISPTDGARGSPVFTPFPDDPYMLVRHAYSPTTPDTDTAWMAVHTQPTLSPGYSAKLTEAMSLSPPSFRKRYKSSYKTPSSSSSPASSPTLPSQKRYWGTSKLIVDTETKSDESKDEGTDSKSEKAASDD
ncbi:hypothetical protein Tco_1486125 [Tanacetum coccineum]